MPLIFTDTEDQCRNAGGAVIGFVRQGAAARDAFGRQLPGNIRCSLPDPKPVAPSPPVNVTVSPNIQTQVSPQVSPVFQQQFQPDNSPMTGGTQQTGASQTAPGGGITAAEARVMAEEARAEEAARAQREYQLALREALAAEREKTARPPLAYTGGGGTVNDTGGGYVQAPPTNVPVPASGGGASYPSGGGSIVSTDTLEPDLVAPQKSPIDWKIFAILGGLGLFALSGRNR